MKILLITLFMCVLLAPDFTEARRGGGFRSSSRSYSSRSYSKPSTSSRSYSGSKRSAKSYTTKKSAIATKTAKINSKIALSKFKAKSKPTQSYSSLKKSSPIVNKYSSRTSYARLRTYSSRRTNFYSNYNPPTYVFNSSPSFGAFDAMFLWMMLDRPSYHSAYYHHQNDAGFKEWRKEAEKQAATNAQLKEKLDRLDAEMKQMKGVKVDPEFVPYGVDADIMLSKDVVDKMKEEKKPWWML